MRYKCRVNKETGELQWHDSDGEPCELPPMSEYMKKHRNDPKQGKIKGWPMMCEASGCHREQVGKMQKMLSDAGCPTEFTPDGRAIYTSRSHRAKSLRIRRIHDKNAGYSDPVPT